MTLSGARRVLLFFLLALSGAAGASGYSAVGDEPAVLYDAPSYNGTRLFIAPAHMPVERLFAYQDWTKIRDVTGDMAWIETKMLGSGRFVVVSVPVATVYMAADSQSAVVFLAAKNVILAYRGAAVSGWAGVSHPDGKSGYVRTSDVWGI